jgi:hypothetical protein
MEFRRALGERGASKENGLYLMMPESTLKEFFSNK